MSKNVVKFDLNQDFLLILNDERQQQTVKIENKKEQNDKKNENICRICEKKYSVKYYLIKHMKNQHPNEISSKVYFCDHCPKKYFVKKCIITHLKSKHQKGKEIKFECDFDGKTFETKQKLYQHMKNHHLIQFKECQICGEKTKRLDRHMKQVHATETDKIQCQICNKIYKNQSALKIHLKTHNKQHQCQVCGRKFPNSARLKEHQKIHENQFTFRCEQCQKNFVSLSNLRSHLKTHEKNRIKQHKCQQCEYSTDVKYSLKNHLKTHDRNRIKNFKCNQCDYKTDRMGDLKLHLQIHNPNRAKFPCLYCNYEATQRSSLKTHVIRKHS
ncbi:hypothetical protein PVAND_017398 [Polypedilum vanderplanki]|uniref:C2H2-type domain-containing protein n=1 Tax=Polypedilum vanderplanki TaxID=319348 RepID=A0A9J6BIX5_POLVA|nr:hypothetical protein PVAND_017398 [Polypedilum vanderplanki]